MKIAGEFWLYLERLLASHPVVIDRPKDSHHPRYPEIVYPLDYGYLEGTTTVDGGGVDLWLGSLPARSLSGVVLTVDLVKSDAEIKLLLGCTPTEMQQVLDFHNQGEMRAIFIPAEYN